MVQAAMGAEEEQGHKRRQWSEHVRRRGDSGQDRDENRKPDIRRVEGVALRLNYYIGRKIRTRANRLQ